MLLLIDVANQWKWAITGTCEAIGEYRDNHPTRIESGRRGPSQMNLDT